MNIAYIESTSFVEAKTCGCKEKGVKIAYSFIDSYHNLCVDKKDVILAEIEACVRLKNYSRDDVERNVIQKEIAELKMALDFLP
jgi:hypothetical protein